MAKPTPDLLAALAGVFGEPTDGGDGGGGEGERPPGVPPGAVQISDTVWQYRNPYSGRVEVYQPNPYETETNAYFLSDDFPMPEGADGLSGLAETVRHNKTMEALGLRQLALDAATKALSGYLDATKDIATRRKGAFEEARELLPFLVSPSQEFFSGLEPGGTLATAAGRYGLPFSPVQIQHKQLTPELIAQEGTISPEVASMLTGIRGAG